LGELSSEYWRTETTTDDVCVARARLHPTLLRRAWIRRQHGLSSRHFPVTYSRRGVLRIRNARAPEAPMLEALQRRSSNVWEEYREQLAANPDAIELPQQLVEEGWVRVAVDAEDRPVGFSVVILRRGPVHELDGLFVEPDQMNAGVGRALVEDAAARAKDQGAEALEVTAGPAQGFYDRVGFNRIGTARTRFGPAVRMRRELEP